MENAVIAVAQAMTAAYIKDRRKLCPTMPINSVRGNPQRHQGCGLSP
jgi:hypothetical protein